MIYKLDITIANPYKIYLNDASNLRYILVGDNLFPFIYYANSHIYYNNSTNINDLGNI